MCSRWEPDHLSAYALTLDEGSLWRAAGVTGLPRRGRGHRPVLGARAPRRARRGYEHYEISNYARPGRRSRHNQIYWRAEEYLALGPGACGFLGRRALRQRQAGRALLRARRERRALPIDSHELLTAAPAARRAADPRPAPRGRHARGLARRAHRASSARRCPRCSTAWRERGPARRATDGRARLTEEGFLLSDALFVELL